MDKVLISARIDFVIKQIDLATNDLADVELTNFDENSLLARGVSFSLEQICEHVSKLKDIFKDEYPNIPWNKIYDTRIVLAHQYTKVDTRIVYRTVKNDLPPLRKQLLEIKANL